jgi:hypothetical protein
VQRLGCAAKVVESHHNAKAVFLSVRLMPAEAKQLDAAVQKSGIAKSEWVRKTLISAAKIAVDA